MSKSREGSNIVPYCAGIYEPLPGTVPYLFINKSRKAFKLYIFLHPEPYSEYGSSDPK
jgi:hypothetical protein